MRSLVTGSSGLLGRCLTSLLRARGDQLRLFDLVPPETDETPATPSEGASVEFVCADMRDADRVEEAARGVDVIYHLAAGQRMKPQFSALKEDEIYEMNLRGVANVLDAAARLGVRKVVFVSSSGIYGIPRTLPCTEDHPTRPLGAYGYSKLEAEGLCRQAIARGLDVTVLRPMSIFGPGMTGVFAILFDWVCNDRPVYLLGRGTNRLQFVSASDLGEACIRAALSPKSRGGFYNIGADPATVVTAYDQVRALIEHAGSRSTIVRVPNALLRSAARGLHAIGLSPIVPEHYLLADANFVLDISRARVDLEWQPQQGNVELMNAAYDWYVEHADTHRPKPHPVLRLLDAAARLRPANGS